MDDKLTKLFNEFCSLKDELNSSNVTEKTVDIIGRFAKAVRNAENVVLDPPKRDTSFDAELHLKASTYAPLKKKDEWANPVKEQAKKVVKPTVLKKRVSKAKK